MPPLLSSLSLPHDLSIPRTVDIAAVVKQLQGRYVDEAIGIEKSKVQQYLGIRPAENWLASYALAAYLQAGGEQRPNSDRIMHWVKLIGGGRGWGTNHCGGPLGEGVCAGSTVRYVLIIFNFILRFYG